MPDALLWNQGPFVWELRNCNIMTSRAFYSSNPQSLVSVGSVCCMTENVVFYHKGYMWLFVVGLQCVVKVTTLLTGVYGGGASCGTGAAAPVYKKKFLNKNINFTSQQSLLYNNMSTAMYTGDLYQNKLLTPRTFYANFKI